MALERELSLAGATISQTVGPYFHLGLKWLFREEVASPALPGRHITVRGLVLDGDGAPVPDALLELWQANADGEYVQPASAQTGQRAVGFSGFARVPTDEHGAFRFRTIMPGRVPASSAILQAPHIAVQLFMRGLLRQLATRIYFADQPSNGEDPVLLCVPEARRATLLARPQAEGPDVFEWNVILQGTAETVFFDY
jgi:protocatechuate 3,4-dioxygenase alpha subunit